MSLDDSVLEHRGSFLRTAERPAYITKFGELQQYAFPTPAGAARPASPRDTLRVVPNRPLSLLPDINSDDILRPCTMRRYKYRVFSRLSQEMLITGIAWELEPYRGDMQKRLEDFGMCYFGADFISAKLEGYTGHSRDAVVAATFEHWVYEVVCDNGCHGKHAIPREAFGRFL